MAKASFVKANPKVMLCVDSSENAEQVVQCKFVLFENLVFMAQIE